MYFNKSSLKHYPEKSRLCFKVLQCPYLKSHRAIVLYSFLSSFSGPVRMKQCEIARRLKRSTTWVQRAARELEQHHLLKRKYTTYKRVIYILELVKDQIELIKNPVKSMFKTLDKILNKKKRPLKKFAAPQYPSVLPEPTKETNINKIINRKGHNE
jgi:predicted transcriptional regulator